VVLVAVPRRTPMALLGQPAAASMETSCSAFDNVCQLDALFEAGGDTSVGNVPSAIRCTSKCSGDNRNPRLSTSAKVLCPRTLMFS
jgi:hypothetical protein